MEFMLQAVVVIFMLFLCALCLFAVVVIARDIVRESASNKKDADAQKSTDEKEPVQVVVQPVLSTAVPAPVAEEPVAPVVEEPVAPIMEEVATAETSDSVSGVVFSKVSLTMAEKYAALSSEILLDSFILLTESHPGS